MNKTERKRRAAEARRNQKLARRAKNQAQGNDSAPPPRPQHVDASTEAPSPFDDPVLKEADPTLEAEVVMMQAQHEIERARQLGLSDERAREMLINAAELLDEIVQITREAVGNATPEQRAEATMIVEAKPERGVNGQSAPRRGTNPLVNFMRIGKQAARLLERILRTTNPGVSKLTPA